MPIKTNMGKILGFLLSLSVAVLGNAFATSSNSPAAAFATSGNPGSRGKHHRRTWKPTIPVATKYSKTLLFDEIDNESERDADERATDEQVEAIIAEHALRGGGTAQLPAAMPAMPTLRDFQKFALPCLALWVSGPLLSLVDTSFVGLSGSAADSAKQLAALGPATTFFDGATYLFAFLNVATTNLYSSARAQKGPHSNEAESVVRTAARVARNCGLGLLLFLLFAARPLLKLYIGTNFL